MAPWASSSSFTASILAPWSFSRTASCPCAIVRLSEWSVIAAYARPLAWAAAIMSRNASLPSLSVVCIWRSPWGAAIQVGSVASAEVTWANVR